MKSVEGAFLETIRGKDIFTRIDGKPIILRYANGIGAGAAGLDTVYKFDLFWPDGEPVGYRWYTFENLRALRILELGETLNPDGTLTVRDEQLSAIYHPQG